MSLEEKIQKIGTLLVIADSLLFVGKVEEARKHIHEAIKITEEDEISGETT